MVYKIHYRNVADVNLFCSALSDTYFQLIDVPNGQKQKAMSSKQP